MLRILYCIVKTGKLFPEEGHSTPTQEQYPLLTILKEKTQMIDIREG